MISKIRITSLVVATVISFAAMTPTFAKTTTVAAKKAPAAAAYKCDMCPMQFTAAQAKKDKYGCPCCKGKLEAVKPISAKKPV